MSYDFDFIPTPGQAHLARAQELCRQYQLTSPEALAEEMAALYQIVSAASVGGLMVATGKGRSRLADNIRCARATARKAQRAFAGALRDDTLAAGAVFANVYGSSADAARQVVQQFLDLPIKPGSKPAQTHIRSLIMPLIRFWALHRQTNRKVSLAHTIADHEGTWVRPASARTFLLPKFARSGALPARSCGRKPWALKRPQTSPITV